MSKVHIHNISGSNLELATVGTMMDKNLISYEAYDEAKLMESSEIQKYLTVGFIKFLTPEQAAQARADMTKPEPLPESVADLEMEVPQPLQKAYKKLSEGLEILQKHMKEANKGATVNGKSKQLPKSTVISGNPSFVLTDDNGAITSKGVKKTAANEDPENEFPQLPPPGMMPKNEPVKRFLGKPPYTQPMSPADQIKYIQECADIGILTEIAMLALPGKPRDLARQKLKEVRASLAGVPGI